MGPRCAQAGFGAALAALLGACGDDESGGSGGGDAASASAGSGGAEHAYIDLPKRSGTVTVFESHVEGVRETNLVGAFLDIEDGFPGSCADETIGPCTLTFCRSGAVSRDALVDAGSLSIEFGEGSTPVLTERNVATGFYLATLVEDELLTTGVDVVISTSGGRVPSFTSTMTSPPSVTLTSALPPEGGRIATNAPLDLAWTADADEGELVFVLRANSAGEGTSAECVFDVSAGAAQVPAEAIAAVAALHATQSIALEVESRTRSVVNADDFPISLALVVTALAGDFDALRAIGGFDE